MGGSSPWPNFRYADQPRFVPPLSRAVKNGSSETKKLTYKLEYELKNLPIKIEVKEAEINALTEKLSDGDFYNSDPDGFVEMTKELKLAKDQLAQYEERWLELEELSQ